MHFANPDYLISVDELARSIDDANLVVLDTTTTIVAAPGAPFELVTGEGAFRDGHIPGALYVDLERDLSVPADGLLFTLPDVESFARMAGSLGIGRDSRVVTYSTNQPGWAARVWLMLRAFGFDNAAVLNGGFGAWKAAGLPVETGPDRHVAPPAQAFAWSGPSGLFVSLSEVAGAMAGSGATLVNALPPDMFAGTAPIVYGRPGHIPGSVNVPSAALADPATGLYLEPEAMAALFAAEGIAPQDEVIAYCGAGVAASNVVFARMLMGAGRASVYDGSMMEWSRDPSRPLVTRR